MMNCFLSIRLPVLYLAEFANKYIIFLAVQNK